jgi:cysteine-rich repeat protein
MVVVDAGSSPDAGLEPGDDHGDSLAQATDLGGLGRESIGRGDSGSIDRSGDEDFFIFRAELAGTYYVSTRGNTDTFCHLLRADGAQIDSDDDSGSNFNCAIQAYLEEGTYGIRVRHWQRGTGAYALDIRYTPGRVGECGDGQVNAGEQCDDGNRRSGDGCSSQCRNEGPPPNPQDDHSNSGAEATEVSVGDRVDGRLEIQRDVDYFVVTSDRDEQVLIGTLGTTNTECTAESVAGDVLATDEDSGQGVNCRLQVDLRAERAVYIRVEGQEPVIAGVYTLYIARP